jgi:hypothetical protein
MQQHVPFLIGGFGRRVVSIAARLADIFQFTGLSDNPDGTVAAGRFAPDQVAERARWLTDDAGERDAAIERSALVQMVAVGDETPSVDEIADRFDVAAEIVGDSPFVLAGSLQQLVDKLELVLQELEKQGIRTQGVRVMSGFRTPQYNRSGGDPRGRASLSRHMYGDAADIFIDNDGKGAMEDLTRDRRVNINDARVIQAAVNRVEAAHPSLIGGVGVYSGTSAHGPFTHIDTRGYPARWIGTGDN